MELLVIACSSTLQEQVLAFFARAGIASYTQVPEVVGAGQGGGTRLNSEIWPGVNTLFLVALAPGQATAVREWARAYRARPVREGLKVFSLALQEMV